MQRSSRRHKTHKRAAVPHARQHQSQLTLHPSSIIHFQPISSSTSHPSQTSTYVRSSRQVVTQAAKASSTASRRHIGTSLVHSRSLTSIPSASSSTRPSPSFSFPASTSSSPQSLPSRSSPSSSSSPAVHATHNRTFFSEAREMYRLRKQGPPATMESFKEKLSLLKEDFSVHPLVNNKGLTLEYAQEVFRQKKIQLSEVTSTYYQDVDRISRLSIEEGDHYAITWDRVMFVARSYTCDTLFYLLDRGVDVPIDLTRFMNSKGDLAKPDYIGLCFENDVLDLLRNSAGKSTIDLREAIQQHWMALYQVAFEIDPIDTQKAKIDANQARRMMRRQYESMFTTQFQNKLNHELSFIDTLASFDEVPAYHYEVRRALLATFGTVMSRIYSDEFKFHGAEGYVLAQKALFEHLADPKIVATREKIDQELAKYFELPPDTPETHKMFQKEIARRLKRNEEDFLQYESASSSSSSSSGGSRTAM